jgi:UDP-glucose 6-dehydrogenase
VTRAREAQTRWLADRVLHEALNRGLPIVILGKSYKPGSDLMYGSPALLLAHYLRSAGLDFEHHDLHVDGVQHIFSEPAVYVIATKHQEYARGPFPEGSAVVDPHRYVREQPGVELIALGRRPTY